MRFKKEYVETAFAEYCSEKNYAPATAAYYRSIIFRFIDKYGAFDTACIEEHLNNLGAVFKPDHVRNCGYILRKFAEYICGDAAHSEGDTGYIRGDAAHSEGDTANSCNGADVQHAIADLLERLNTVEELFYQLMICWNDHRLRHDDIEAFLKLPPLKRAFKSFKHGRN